MIALPTKNNFNMFSGPVKGAALVRLAFDTLGQYEFAYKAKYLEPMKMLGYLDDENETIRNSAAHAFCQVMHRNAKSQHSARLRREKSGPPFPTVVYKVFTSSQIFHNIHTGLISGLCSLHCKIKPFEIGK